MAPGEAAARVEDKRVSRRRHDWQGGMFELYQHHTDLETAVGRL